MKNLILILLFIPLVSFGQEDRNYSKPEKNKLDTIKVKPKEYKLIELIEPRTIKLDTIKVKPKEYKLIEPRTIKPDTIKLKEYKLIELIEPRTIKLDTTKLIIKKL